MAAQTERRAELARAMLRCSQPSTKSVKNEEVATAMTVGMRMPLGAWASRPQLVSKAYVFKSFKLP